MVASLAMVASMRQTCQTQFSICHLATKRTRQTRQARQSTRSLTTQMAPITILLSSISLTSINTPNTLSSNSSNFTRRLAGIIIMLEAVYHRCNSSRIHIHLNTPTILMELANKRSLISPSPLSRQTSTRTPDTSVAVAMVAEVVVPKHLKLRDGNA